MAPTTSSVRPTSLRLTLRSKTLTLSSNPLSSSVRLTPRPSLRLRLTPLFSSTEPTQVSTVLVSTATSWSTPPSPTPPQLCPTWPATPATLACTIRYIPKKLLCTPFDKRHLKKITPSRHLLNCLETKIQPGTHSKH